MNRAVLVKWIEEALKLSPGESLYLPGDSRENAHSLVARFRREMQLLTELDSRKSNKLQFRTAIKSGLFWIEVKRISGSALVGFKKGLDGKTERVTVNDPERARRLSFMKEDGLTLSEVEEIEGELTEDERAIFSR